MKKDALSVRFRRGLRQWAAVLPFISVGLMLFVVFVLYPQIKNIYIAFTDYSIMPGAETPFVFFDNFKRAFEGMFEQGTDAYYFWISFRNNLLAVLVTVPGQLILGLLVAVMIHNIRFGKNAYKIMFYIAVICDWVVVANIFDYIFQPDNGSLVNYVLLKLHIISEPIAWLQETWSGNLVIWVFSIWKGFGWVMIIYTAALQGIPNDLYEAATIDGASTIDKFFHITLPSIRGTTFYLLINLINGAMNIFIQVFLLTKGNPVGTTDVMMNYIYTRAFNYFEFGYAAACGLMMGVFVFTTSMFLKRYLRYGQDQLEGEKHEKRKNYFAGRAACGSDRPRGHLPHAFSLHGFLILHGHPRRSAGCAGHFPRNAALHGKLCQGMDGQQLFAVFCEYPAAFRRRPRRQRGDLHLDGVQLLAV